MTNVDIAELLFPEVNLTVEDLLKQYPERNLPTDAEVTRFAPSPTGYIHIGGIFQCLINSYFAKSHNGLMFLRCEDTDKLREVEGAANLIYPTLTKMGIDVQEGFISTNEEFGNYGPYLQSRRNMYYKVFAKDLVSRGLAYPCFCDGDDDDECAEYRNEQKRLGVPIGYYGRWAKCRNLSYEMIKANLDAGKPFKIRIKAEGDGEKKIIVHDMLRGDLVMPENYIDYVILKSDKTALYHLAHLVDDTLMHTTTVIRDESWLPSLPLHYQLFKYFNFKQKNYVHTAQVMTIDKETGGIRKISKRYDDWADSRWFLEKGYPVLAVHEYLLNLINSNFEKWRNENPDKDIKEFPFEIEKMNKSGCIFDLERLNRISKNVLSKMNKDELFEKAYDYALNYDEKLKNLIEEDKEYFKKVINIEREKEKPRKDLTTYAEIYDDIWYMYDKEFINKEKFYEFSKPTSKEEIIKIVETYLEKCLDLNDTKDEWFNKIKTLCGELNYACSKKEYLENADKFKGDIADVCSILRSVFTSKSRTPDLYEIIEVLGKDKLIKRFEYFKEIYNN